MIVNTAILAEPINWATIFLMLLIAGFAGALALNLAGKEYATVSANPATTLKPAADAA